MFGPIIQHRSPTLFAGRFRHPINIVAQNDSQDSTGGFNPNNTTIVATVWASIEALSGAEKFAAHEFVSQVSHQVVIRYMPGISSALQVQFAGRRFQIESVLNPDERNKILILLCIEINDSNQQVVSS